MVEKNEEVTLEIEDIGVNGEGVGRVSGYTLFVKDGIIGDILKVKIMKVTKNYGFARLLEIVSPSPYRVKSVCPVARQCGGCQVQELSYEQQLKFKENKVRNNLARIGGITDYEMEPIIGMEEPFHYRNKAQFPMGLNADGKIISGFYASRTHSIIECDDCAIGITENAHILKIIKEYMIEKNIKPYDEVNNTGIIRHVLIRKGFKTGEIMVCIVINAKTLPDTSTLVESLLKVPGMKSISLNINTKVNNVILGKKIINLYGEGYISDYIGDVKFRISPRSFYQVNPLQTDKLYSTALEYAGLTGKETVWDLYCGVGTISLFLAKRALKVYGVEIVSEAIDDARINAKINNIDNAEFFVGKAEEVLPDYYADNHNTADVIVVDPPRKGCEQALLQTITLIAPAKIVYVSCDSATLARDVNWLSEHGYKLEKVRSVDMFPHTGHVETIVALHRINS